MWRRENKICVLKLSYFYNNVCRNWPYLANRLCQIHICLWKQRHTLWNRIIDLQIFYISFFSLKPCNSVSFKMIVDILSHVNSFFHFLYLCVCLFLHSYFSLLSILFLQPLPPPPLFPQPSIPSPNFSSEKGRPFMDITQPCYMRPDTSSSVKAGWDNRVGRKGPKTSSKVREGPCSHC